MYYRFKNTDIIQEAMQLIEPNTPSQVAAWCNGKIMSWGEVGSKVQIQVASNMGVRTAMYSQWIIKDGPADYTVMSDELFHEQHKPVDEGAAIRP